ncbi:uncharacterized protein [Diadema setosum]|uniref:uncharacterized protein n=1 Tax=Diadema setosum TaxID=31175 RepID=UPI003B3B6844
MYHMDESTEEDWELEHYGLEGSHPSESDDTDSETILYRHIHYGQSDTGNFHTNDAVELLPYSSRHFKTCGELQDENCKNKAHLSSSKRNVDKRKQNDMCRTSCDDCVSDSEIENSKYKVGCNGKQAMPSNIFGTSSSDSNTQCHQKHSSTKSDTDESDVIFVAEEENCSRKEGKVCDHNTEAPFRKHSPIVGNPKRKATKVDREGYKAMSVVEGRQKRKSSVNVKRVHPAEVIEVHDSSDSTTKDSPSPNSKQTQSSDPSPTKEVGLDFFIDSKGMHLDEMRKDKNDAQLAWRQEKRKTQEMLKEASELGFVHWSSDEEDCMVIESCSEEEGINVHIEDRGTSVQEKGTKARGQSKEKLGRYYVQSEQNYVKCHNCMEVGHVKANCPKPPYVPACIFCGVRGHTDRECPKALCFNCSLPGHQARTCPVKRNLRYASCNRCQMSGHLRKMCPDLWRQYHLTTEHGPLMTATRSEKKTKKDVYCSNCSEKGHKYYDCHSERMDDFIMFTYDEVCQYDTKFVRKQTAEGNFPFYNHHGDWRDIILRDRQALLHQGQKRKLPAQEVDDVNGVEISRGEEGSSKKRQRVTAPSVQAGSQHHITQDKVTEIQVGVNEIRDDKNIKSIADRGSSDDDPNPAGLCLPIIRKKSKKKSKKPHQCVVSNKIQKTSKTERENLPKRGVNDAFPHPAAADQREEQVSKKERRKLRKEKWLAKERQQERQRLRKEKWLAKRQQQSLANGSGDGFTKHDTRNPGGHTSTRGFVLNRTLFHDGSHCTQTSISNSEFISEDFPRSSSQCDGILFSGRGQREDGVQKGHQKNKLGQKIKSQLLHLRERLGVGGAEAEGNGKRDKRRPRRRKSRTKGETGSKDISISGLFVATQSSAPPVGNHGDEFQHGKKRRRKRRGR